MFFNFLNIRIEKVLDLSENKKTELLEFFYCGAGDLQLK